ncbi:MAG: hypothetical protein ACFFCE_06055 [Promethearchaeota archaeon]
MVNIRICPRCKKPTLRNAINVAGGIAPNLYECKDSKCGYIGRFFIEVDSEDYQLDPEEFSEE